MKLELDGLTKEFGDFTAVNHINLTMTNGVYGLLGVNGAGKTTLMRMLCTLLKPTSGTICCNGKDIFSMDSEYRKLLGYLPQDFGFYPEFTVEDYLLYIAALKGIRPVVAKKRVKELIAKVGLSKAAHKKMKKLIQVKTDILAILLITIWREAGIKANGKCLAITGRLSTGCLGSGSFRSHCLRACRSTFCC